MPDRDMDRRDDLVDRGWQQMSEILDREMPQRKPRRRLLFWLPIAAIGVFALSYATWASGAFSDEKSGEEPIQIEQNTGDTAEPEIMVEIAPAVNSNDSRVGAYARASENTLSVDPKLVERTGEGNEFTSTPTDIVSGIGSGKVLVNRALEPIDAENTLNESLGQARNRVEDIPSLTDLSIAVEEDHQDLTASAPVTQRLTVPVNYAPAASNKPFAMQKASVDVIAPQALQFKGSFGLDAYLSSHWDSPVKLQGIETGLLASWEFAPRWSATVGLAYGHHRKLGIADLSPGKSDDQELAAIPNDPDTSSFSGSTAVDLSRVSYDTAETLINKLNYLHFPVHFEYRLTRGLSARAGVRASYMMGAPVRQMGQVFITNPAFPNAALVDANSAPRILLEEGVVRRWDVAPMVGIGWDISRLLAIDVQYQHGLIPYIDRDATGRSDFNRTLSVGIRMKLL